jgi:hypothetical protein
MDAKVVAMDNEHFCTSATRRAAYALYTLAIADFVHILAAIVTSTRGPRTFFIVAAVLFLNAVLSGLLVYAGRGVRQGRRFGLAFGLLCYIGLAIVMGAVVAARAYYGTKALLCVQIGCIAVFAVTAVLVVVAWVSQMQHSPGIPPMKSAGPSAGR